MSSSFSSKKDSSSLASSLAGELAANLFDKLKNKKLNTSLGSSSSNSSSSNASNSNANENTSNFDSASSLISNLAISFHKNITNNNSSANNSSNNNNNNGIASIINVSNANKSKSLIVFDHNDNYDENNDEFLKKINNDQVDLADTNTNSINNNNNNNSYKTTSNKLPISQSDFDFNNKASMNNPNKNINISGVTDRLPSSSSLYKLTSRLDDLFKSDLANTVVDTATAEAELFKKKILTKKKSIELSFENIKNKVNNSNTNVLTPTPSSSQSFDADAVESHEKLVVSSVSAAVVDEKPKSVVDTPTLIKNVPLESLQEEVKSQEKLKEKGTDDIPEIKPQIEEPTSVQELQDNEDIHKQELRETVPSSPLNVAPKTDLMSDYKVHLLVIIVTLIIPVLIVPGRISMVFFLYLFGLLNGIAIMVLIFYLIIRFNLNEQIVNYIRNNFISKTNDNKESNTNVLQNTECYTNDSTVERIQILLIQSARLRENKNFDGVYKGWMNELREPYNPEDYFLNKTRSVFVNLDGTILRLQRTFSKVPKRAVISESIGNISFSEQNIFDLADCEVFILPKELCRKRYWSKKYPLCLKNVKPLTETLSSNLSLSSSPGSDTNNILNNTLILFARTDREKEEWFRLFKKSSAKSLLDSTHYLKKIRTDSKATNLNELNKELNAKEANKNLTNIAFTYDASSDRVIYKILNENSSSKSQNEGSSSVTTPEELKNEISTQTENGLLYDSSLNFMNTFLIRIFADFFTHKHWIEQIQTKIQNKLNKIKMPYFMEELKITGLDLGSVVPLIKQTSDTWYDEKGLWVHLDIDYCGGFQMSLATKLNLMRLKTNSGGSAQTPSSSSSTPNANSSSIPIFTFKNIKNENASVEEPSLNIIQTATSNSSMPININQSLNSSSVNESLNSSSPIQSSLSSSLSNDIINSTNNYATEKYKRSKNSAITNSDEEDSAESSGDEYVHNGFGNDEDSKFIET